MLMCVTWRVGINCFPSIDVARTLSLPSTLDVSPIDSDVDTNETTVPSAPMPDSNSGPALRHSNRGVKLPLRWDYLPKKD